MLTLSSVNRDANAEVPVSYERSGGETPIARRVADPLLLVSPGAARALVAAVLLVALLGGFFATGHAAEARAVALAGEDLTRLLRSMAALKMLFVIPALAALFWRLGAPSRGLHLLLYAGAVGAMVAGPGLIWSMAYVRVGALLLHGGLLVSVVLLWRDPVLAARLAERLKRRARRGD